MLLLPIMKQYKTRRMLSDKNMKYNPYYVL